MITLTLQIPEPVAAEYYAAAEQLNGRFQGASPKIDAKSLMSFALARHDCHDLCGQFDLALRLIQGPPDPNFPGAVLDPDFGRETAPVPTQPARFEEAA